jgi:predicted nucleotidyltransferase
MDLDKNSIFSINWRMFYCLTPFQSDPFGEKYGLEIEREIEKKELKIAHETVLTYLNHFSQTGILIKEKKGRQVFFSLNTRNALPILSLLEQDRTNLFLRESTQAMEIFELGNLISDCYLALVFGSVARKQQRERSDIDVLIVEGKIDETELKKKEALYGKISVHSIAKKDLRKHWHQKPIYKGIWKDRVVLKNYHNFWEFVLKEGKP